MPTYNRGFIIELAIQSIINQKDHTWNIELFVGDDGDDNTKKLIDELDNSNRLLKLNYIMQNPSAQVFGQRAFIYHDIIYGNSNLWTQNKSMDFFKAGSFVILKRYLFDKVNGYPPGLWKRVDGKFYKKIAPIKPQLCDVSEFDERVIKSSIALQHIDNIWNRKSKGLRNNIPKQLANFYAEPININLSNFISEYSELYEKIKLILQNKNDINKNSKWKFWEKK